MYLCKDDLPRMEIVALGPIDGSATISLFDHCRFAEVKI
jgi:hypothetical protein